MEKNEKIDVFTKIMDIQTKIRTYSKIFNTYSIEIGGSAITEIDKYETRKIVYDKDAISNIEDGILAGVEFELLWLKSKRRYYHRIKIEDEKRIEMLEKRLNF